MEMRFRGANVVRCDGFFVLVFGEGTFLFNVVN